VTTKIEAFCKKQLQKTDNTWSVKPRVPAKTGYGTSRKYCLTADGILYGSDNVKFGSD